MAPFLACGECGSFYGSKVWHSTSKYRRVIWQCNHKFKNDKKCKTPHLYEDKIKEVFIDAINSLIKNKDEILKNYEGIIQALTDTSKLDKESAKLQNECEVVAELLRRCVEENANDVLDQIEYQKRYTDLAERYENIKNGLIKINDKKQESIARRESIEEFIKVLNKSDNLLTKFDEELWNATVETVVVYSEHEITFTFKDGTKLDWNL